MPKIFVVNLANSVNARVEIYEMFIGNYVIYSIVDKLDLDLGSHTSLGGNRLVV
jgi:hypothetical protein